MTIISKKDSPDILLVDLDHILHRAYHVYTELRTQQTGLPSGVFYGSLSIIKTQLEKLSPKRTILVWKGKNSGQKRKEIDPSYKSGRIGQAYFVEQFENLKKFFSYMNFEQYYTDDGWESDDVIATLVTKLSSDNKIYILSGDHDFFQLVSENVSCLVPGNSKKPDVLYTSEVVVQKYGVSPEYLADLFSICGEDSDTIMGIPSFGEKTASKLLISNGHIKTWFNNIEAINASKRQIELLCENKQRLVTNKRLISLKNRDIPIVKYPQINNQSLAEDLMNYYEIKRYKTDDFVIN